MFRRLPIALLVVVAFAQWTLATTVPISPWVGGGFGMFATVDGGHRAVTVDGDSVAGEAVARFAAAPFRAAASELVDRGEVTVWKPEYDRDMGRVAFVPIVSQDIP